MPPYKRIIYHHKRYSTWTLTFVLFLGLLVSSSAIEDEQKSSSLQQQQSIPSASSTSSTSSTPLRDEIYIDDEGLEGSGGHGEIHADLEKDPDYSGSGFGPDDEDSSTNHHSSTTHHHSSSSSSSSSSTTGGSTNDGIGSSSNINSINNRQDITNRKDSTRVTEYDIGSGDGDDNDDHHDTIDHDNEDDDEDDHDDEIITHHTRIKEPYDHDFNKNINNNLNNNNSDKDNDNDSNSNNNNNKKDMIDQDHHDNIDDKNEEELYTDVTDPRHDDDDKLSSRSGESGIKDVSKQSNEIDLDLEHSKQSPTDQVTHQSGEVYIMNAKNEDRTASFFAQPGILAAVIGGAVVGLLCAILVVMFIVYRMRKKDEGSYALDEPKRSPAVNSYAKNANNREFYA